MFWISFNFDSDVTKWMYITKNHIFFGDSIEWSTIAFWGPYPTRHAQVKSSPPRHSPTASLTSPHPNCSNEEKDCQQQRHCFPQQTQQKKKSTKLCFLECFWYFIMIEKWKAFLDFEEFLACVENHPILFLGCHLDFLYRGCFSSPRRHIRKNPSIKIFIGDVRGPVSAWRDVTWLWNHRHDYHTQKKSTLQKKLPCFFYHTFSPLTTLNHTKPPSFPLFCPKTVLYQGIRIAAHIHNPRPFKLEMSHHVLRGPTSNFLQGLVNTWSHGTGTDKDREV